MKAGPANATKLLLDDFPLDSPPKRLRNLVVDIILEKGWETSKTVAEENAEKWLPKVSKRLLDESNKLTELGHPPRLIFNESSSEHVQGYCFVDRSDSQETREQKSRRLESDSLYVAVRNISDDEFEWLCGRLLRLLGVQNPQVTRKSADDGIDFFGKLKLKNVMPSELTPTIQQQLDVWILGQAKKYVSSKPGTPEIRDLVGSIVLGRAGAFGGSTGPLENINIRAADPVFAMLVTTGNFSSNAWRLLQRSGVVGIDGHMLSAYLADRGVGAGKGGKFDAASFQDWLKT